MTQDQKIEIISTKITNLLTAAKETAKEKKLNMIAVMRGRMVEIFLDGQAEGWRDGFEAGKQYALKCAFEEVTEPPANPYES